jgi:4-carboxymuconolactone decarboxylase
MPRIPYADRETLSPDAQAIYDGGRVGLIRVMANASDSLVPWVGIVRNIRNSPDLDPLHRELVILRALRTLDAPDEWSGHEALARTAGATDEQIQAVRDGVPLDAEAGLVVALVGDLFDGRTPSDERFAEVLAVISPRALVEAIMISGLYTTAGRLVEAIGPGAGPLEE